MPQDPYRIRRILDLLGKYWVHNPDLRLGQIVGNFVGHTDRGEPRDAYYFEDAELEQKLREALKENDHGPTKALPQHDHVRRVHRR